METAVMVHRVTACACATTVGLANAATTPFTAKAQAPKRVSLTMFFVSDHGAPANA